MIILYSVPPQDLEARCQREGVEPSSLPSVGSPTGGEPEQRGCHAASFVMMVQLVLPVYHRVLPRTGLVCPDTVL